MYYSSGLEYIIGSTYSANSHNINYFSKNYDDNPSLERENPIIFEPQYSRKTITIPYRTQQQYQTTYPTIQIHLLTPQIFLKPSRPKTRFIDDNHEARSIAEEVFELMMPAKIKDFCGTENPSDFLVKEKLPESISINILPFDEFKALHSRFGAWNTGILGFSVNENNKKIFVRESNLDVLMLVIGHEIGHVLTETLPNKHDEEAKAFAFSIEWAKTIKQHNVANLGSSIKDNFDFQPARNGLHDVAFSFVDFMIKKGRKAIELHNDLVKKYISVFDRVY